MNIRAVFRSVLIFLLLCYGKKFVDANERKAQEHLSQQTSLSNSSQINIGQKSSLRNQNVGIQQASASRNNTQQVSTSQVPNSTNPGVFSNDNYLIELDISRFNPDGKFTYRQEADGTHTFTTVEPYLFRLVRCVDKVVWRPKDDNYCYEINIKDLSNGKYAVKVLIPVDENDAHVNPGLMNGSTVDQPVNMSTPVSNVNVGLKEVMGHDSSSSEDEQFVNQVRQQVASVPVNLSEILGSAHIPSANSQTINISDHPKVFDVPINIKDVIGENGLESEDTQTINLSKENEILNVPLNIRDVLGDNNVGSGENQTINVQRPVKQVSLNLKEVLGESELEPEDTQTINGSRNQVLDVPINLHQMLGSDHSESPKSQTIKVARKPEVMQGPLNIREVLGENDLGSEDAETINRQGPVRDVPLGLSTVLGDNYTEPRRAQPVNIINQPEVMDVPLNIQDILVTDPTTAQSQSFSQPPKQPPVQSMSTNLRQVMGEENGFSDNSSRPQQSHVVFEHPTQPGEEEYAESDDYDVVKPRKVAYSPETVKLHRPPHYQQSSGPVLSSHREEFINRSQPRQPSPVSKFSGQTSRKQPVTEVLNLIVLDVSKDRDIEGYDIEEYKDRVIFRAHKSYLFETVKNGTETIWSYKGGDYPYKVVVKDVDGQLKYKVFIPNDQVLEGDDDVDQDHDAIRNQVNMSSVPKASVPQRQHILSPVISSEVNILTLDAQNKLQLNDTSQYSVSPRGNILDYNFVDSARCVEIKFYNETVWKPGSEYPLSFSYDRAGNKFVVNFISASIVCQKQRGEWINLLHQQNPMEKPVGLIPQPIPKAPVADPAEAGHKRPVNDMSNKIAAVVDVSVKKSTNEFIFSKKSADCASYSPKHNFIFKVVRGNSGTIGRTVDIWYPTDESEYVVKVMIDGANPLASINNVTIFLVNGKVKHFTWNKKKWVEVDPSIILDISVNKSTFEFDYYNDKNGTETFVRKSQVLFTGIKSSKGSSCMKTEVDIWETNDPSEYGTKVMVRTTPNAGKYVVMFLVNGSFKLFYQSGKRALWHDESTDISTIKNLKLLGINVADRSHYGGKNNLKSETTYLPPLDDNSIGQNEVYFDLNQSEFGNDVSQGNPVTNLMTGSPGAQNINANPTRISNNEDSNPVQYQRKYLGDSDAAQITSTQTVKKAVVKHVECDDAEMSDSDISGDTYLQNESGSDD